MGARHTKRCPNCDAVLSFSEEEESIKCPCCDSEFTVEELLSSSAGSAVSNVQLAVNSIDDSESGLAYLESITETMDWDDFVLNNSSVTIESVDRVVDKIKIKFANKPDTWLFELESILIPVTKKLEKLSEITEKIKENYSDDCSDELLGFFDNYRFVINGLINNRDLIEKKIEIDLRFMKKFKFEQAKLTKYEKEANELITKLKGLVQVSSVYDLPELAGVNNEREKQIEAELKAKGIDAKEVYKQAIDAYLSSNKRKALDLFSSLNGYHDADSFVSKLKFYRYAENILECNGTTFVIKQSTVKEDESDEGKKKRKSKSVTSNFVGRGCLALFNIVDGVVQTKPVIKNICNFVTAYCNKFYYIDEKANLVCYDFDSKTKKLILKVEGIDLTGDAFIEYPTLGTAIFLGPEEKTEKKGCFASFKKKNETVKEFKTFTLQELNLAESTVTTLDRDVVCISQRFNQDIFYTVGVFDEKGILKENQMKHINASKHKISVPFEREVFIEDVVDGYIIYSLWEPNANNLDLYSLNIETKENHLIEKNIYSYYRSINKKIYYAVGNYAYMPLYCSDLHGHEIQEIDNNCDKIYGVLNNFIYLIRGAGRNRTLLKMRLDGKGRTFLCSNFKQVVSIKNGLIYYLDSNNCLHIVRSDGKEDRKVAENIFAVVAITLNKIFFVRGEFVGTHGKDSFGSSLYYMDEQGHNIHKLAFDIGSSFKFDENTIYYSVDEVAKYRITQKGEDDKLSKRIETYDVKTYYALNVNTLETTRVVMFGAPVFNGLEFTKGCLKKKTVKNEPIVERVEYIYPIPSKIKLLPNTEDDEDEDEDEYIEDEEEFETFTKEDEERYSTSKKSGCTNFSKSSGCSSSKAKKGCGGK